MFQQAQVDENELTNNSVPSGRTRVPFRVLTNGTTPEISQQRGDVEKVHKYFAPTSAVNNSSHVLPPSLEGPPNEELRMKNNLPKSSTKSKPQKPKRRRWTPAEDESVSLHSSENIEA